MSTNSTALLYEEDNGTNDTSSTVTTGIAGLTSLASALPVTESCRKPLSYVSAFTLSVLWHIVYWTSQALTWFAILLPFAITVTLNK